MKNKTFKLSLADRELKIEFNDFAEQASGSCFVQYGDTLVLSTAVMSKFDKLDQDFFPLTVEYEERFYAAGKIRGSRFFKRESKPTDEAICNARLIDRTIRPLFPQELTREVQVVATVACTEQILLKTISYQPVHQDLDKRPTVNIRHSLGLARLQNLFEPSPVTAA